ncbi:MAG: 5-methyltetrahydropteroyltriglutamate--homocysteine S-methyltransferase [Candidatus Omnitrophica bacterium]|nr:5-methyltetrahydropteroyltriglutamate--homocysteine S-methyltransferase [Candidatus Omnitrophota bacterium]
MPKDSKTKSSIKTAVLGYPRIGLNRELKKAVEAFWKGQLSQQELEKEASSIRKENWMLQKDLGIDIIPSNDFSFYDQMLDMTALLGAVPPRFGWKGGQVDLDTYFAMARGVQEKQGIGGKAAQAMEMTKWFDTNYHYIVPEFHRGQPFRLSSEKPFREYKEAQELGIKTRPVLIGPVTYLLLGKSKDAGLKPLDLLGKILPIYAEILNNFSSLGAESIQVDEPCLVLDLDDSAQRAYTTAYEYFSKKAKKASLFLTTYFEGLHENLSLAATLPVSGLHVDVTRCPEQLNDVLRQFSKEKTLSLGVVDGRNIWKTDLCRAIETLESAIIQHGRDRIIIASSCSLMFTPLDLEQEKNLDPEIKSWLAFARQKVEELVVIKKALSGYRHEVSKIITGNQLAMESRKKSGRIHVAKVKERLAGIQRKDMDRKNPHSVRRKAQSERLRLPLFPTTTIGSFPQTPDVRKARADFKAGTLSEKDYAAFVKRTIDDVIHRQSEIGLDVFVHGEFERNDMVEYFGEMLEGFAFMQNGWVQSYGTRCVKPPVIFGDVWRRAPMTVEWFSYAQSKTTKPVKGMLTGPITILQWSFVRDDQPRSETARQIALAICDEVHDLEEAGAVIVQIDEPAIREGLPLRKSKRADYLKWAVECFRLTASGAKDETQIHTHMCYSEFNDIIDSIAAMDADVISIETSRSQMELLDAFVKFRYPNEIGPGLFDIHSPRVPTEDEMKTLLKKASDLLPAGNIWANPDCGLKTRGWPETVLSLKNMVSAAQTMRVLYRTSSEVSYSKHRGHS